MYEKGLMYDKDAVLTFSKDEVNNSEDLFRFEPDKKLKRAPRVRAARGTKAAAKEQQQQSKPPPVQTYSYPTTNTYYFG
jgi:hypothetical protein